MKLITNFVTLASALRRHTRDVPAQDANGWNYIDIEAGIIEGSWYKVGAYGTADAAHAFCASEGGFAPISRTASVMSIYKDLPGLVTSSTYWTGIKKSSGQWRVYQSAQGNTNAVRTPFWCSGDNQGSNEACSRSHAADGCFTSKRCNAEQSNSLCLNVNAPFEITIDSVADAFSTFVTFSDAAGHGCYCSALANDEGAKGGAADATDKICKQWNAARKCTQDAGGACAAETDLSYVWTSDCRSNQDDCKEALCNLDREFATQLNAQSGASLTSVDINTDCVPSSNNPGFDSCCVAAIPWESMRFNSNTQDCVNNAIVEV